MSNPLKFQIYPEVSGVVTMNGEPVEGAIIKRSYKLENRNESEHFTTDKTGKFKFQEKNLFLIRGILPVESIIHQSITINYNNVKYLVWDALKFKQGNDSGLTKLLVSLKCELTNPETDFIIDADTARLNVITGIASWPN